METLVVFVEGKCGEADIEKKVGRSGEGAILYSWSAFHRCLPYFLNDDYDERYSLP
jgi:hypothetical protein